jgi:hypothetical protein
LLKFAHVWEGKFLGIKTALNSENIDCINRNYHDLPHPRSSSSTIHPYPSTHPRTPQSLTI